MGKKRRRKIICVGLAVLLLLAWQEPAVVPASVAMGEVDSAWKRTRAYILDADREPGYDSQWFALGLARGGMDLDSSYFQTFYKNMAAYIARKEGELHRVKYTEYSKAILSLTAVGKDARDVNGYNLFWYLADFSMVTRQGFNGPIWALLALNSNPAYTIPIRDDVEEQTTEKVLVDYLLKREVPGGGWSLTGDTADVDITGMTIQALAPYYRKGGYEAVTAAIDRGLARLSAMQVISTDGFGSMGADNSESCVQVIVALCSLGIDPQKDSRFIKQGSGVVGNLLSYYKPEKDADGKDRVDMGGFMHVRPDGQNNGGGTPGEINGMATEQAFYALTAYRRLLDGKSALYDMSDLPLKKGAAVTPGKDEPSGGENSGRPDDEEASGKTEGDGQKGDKNSKENDGQKEDGSGPAKGGQSSGTTKKPSGATKKPTGTIKTAGAKKTSGTKSSSGGANTGGDGKNQDTENSELSDISELPESSGIPESSGLPETVDEGADGWSFAGEEYVPDAEGSQEAAPPEEGRPEEAVPYGVLVVCILGCGIAGGGVVWHRGKRR